MPTTCEIEFENNPSKVVYSGHLLRGTVHLALTHEIPLEQISIHITGIAYAYWTEKEQCLNEKQTLFSFTNGEVRLMPGSYSYPFEFSLPHEIPTSFESKSGYIRYKARVVIQDFEEFEIPFTVIKEINLNADRKLQEPAIVTGCKTFSSHCLFYRRKSEPIEITARTPVGGYVPGQTINLVITVSNKSDKRISKFVVKLIKKVDFHGHANIAKHYHESSVITKAEAHGCDMYQNKDIRVNIEVPSSPPSDDTSSKIIKVQYYLEIKGSVFGCHANPSLELPITIGTLPILDEPEETQYQECGLSSSPSAPPLSDENGPSTPPIVFPCEPPTYEETMQFGNLTEREFIPKYPVFKRRTSYSQ